MPSYRTRPNTDFTIIRNAVLRDPELTLKAKGLLALMLTFPHDWTYNNAHLQKLSADGRDGTRAAIRELEESGYITREQTVDEAGRFSQSDYVVSDQRCDNNENHNNAHQDGISSVDGFSGAGETVAGKSVTTNTDLTKTERPTKETIVGKADMHDEKIEEQTREEKFNTLRDALIEIWNSSCGELAKTRIVSSDIEKKLRGLWRRYHEDELTHFFRIGIRTVRDDPYWLGRKAKPVKREGAPYGLINYLRHMEDKANAALEEQVSRPNLAIKPGRVWYTEHGVALVKEPVQDGWRVQIMRPITDEVRQGDEIFLSDDQFKRERAQ